MGKVVFRGRFLQFPTRKRVSKVHMMTSVFKPCGSSPSPLNTKRRVLCDVCVRLGPSRGLRLFQHSAGGLYFSLFMGIGHLFDLWLGFPSFNEEGRRGITTCEAHPVSPGVALGFFRRFLRLSNPFSMMSSLSCPFRVPAFKQNQFTHPTTLFKHHACACGASKTQRVARGGFPQDFFRPHYAAETIAGIVPHSSG